MARYTGPKHRLARREGANIFDKGSSSLSRRLAIPPGVHGPRRKSKHSDYSLQLREKQKAKRIYGILERQFRRYFQAASRIRGKTGEALLQALERRLDNVVYRLGLAPSRAMARQLVSHGHVSVDGRKVTAPSYALGPKQVVTLLPKALEIPAVKKLLEAAESKIPPYLERKVSVGRMIKIPSREEIPTDVNEQLIIEYYSR